MTLAESDRNLSGKGAGTSVLPTAALLTIGATIAFAAVMIFWHLGLLPLLNPDEGRNASVAWDMQQAGTWLVPSYDGLPYLDKPAFFFRAVALSLSLFGHSETAVRLPSALFACGTLGLVFAFCRREFDLRTAALAVAVVASTPLFFVFGRYVIFDMTLTFFVCGAIFAGYYAEAAPEVERVRWSRLSAAAMGFAMLVKGPVGFIIPVLVLAVAHIEDSRQGAIKRLLCWQNFVLMLAIFLPWFIGASIERHDFPYYGVMFESVKRFTTNSAKRVQPFWFYPPVIVGTMACWSLILPHMLYAAFERWRTLSRADRLLFIWAAVVTVFFSISQSKLPGYVLSAVVALGILIARRFADALELKGREWSIRSGAFLLALVAAAGTAIAARYILNADAIDAFLRQKYSDAPLMSATARQVAMPLAVGFGAVTLACLWAIGTRNVRLAFLAFAACPLLFITLGLPVLVAGEQHRSDKILASEINQHAPDAEIVCYHCFPPGLSFYLGRHVTLVTDEGKNEEKGGKEIPSNYIPYMLGGTKDWPPEIVKTRNFGNWLTTQKQKVFLLVPKYVATVQLESMARARHSQLLTLGNGTYRGLLIQPEGH